MINKFYGNCVRIYITASELAANKSKRVNVTLPDGYSYETIHILYSTNISEITPYFFFTSNGVYHFPPVRSHSPSTFSILVANTSKDSEIRICIEKFGQIPDPNYFSDVFEPILVMGDDGKTYNVIPSNQFK